jgi:transposase
VEALLTNPDLPLPDDPAALQQLVRELLAEVRRLRQENEQLRHRLDQALRLHFGQRSERSRPRRARVPRDSPERDESGSRPGHGRQPLPAHLPRERVEYDLAEEDRRCPCCGQPRACIGEQVSEQLDYRPASYFVVQHARKTYACQSCDGPSERRFTTAGPAVVGPIPKGLPGPGLLAHLLTCEYADHLPLHRQVGIVARSGVRLSRSTLCDWMASAAALYSVVGTCKHLGIDPFAYLREMLPALFALGDRPGENRLADWLPDAWRKRQRGPAAGPATRLTPAATQEATIG